MSCPVGYTAADYASHGGEDQRKTATDDKRHLARDEHDIWQKVVIQERPTTIRHAGIQSSVFPSKHVLFCPSMQTRTIRMVNEIASMALHSTSTCRVDREGLDIDGSRQRSNRRPMHIATAIAAHAIFV